MKGFSSKRRGQARERERDHTFLLTQLPREKRFGWDALRKFHGRGSDVCGESEGFKKECVYSVKKTLSHIATVLCLSFSVRVDGHSVRASTCGVHRSCGLLLLSGPSVPLALEIFSFHY